MRRLGRLMLPSLLAILAPLPGGPCSAQQPAQGLVLVQSLVPTFPVSGFRCLDLNGDGLSEVLVVGNRGEVRVYVSDKNARKLRQKAVGTLVLEQPGHTLIALADVEGLGKPPQLVAVSPKGLFAWRPGKDGAFAGAGIPLTSGGRRRQAKFRLRVGRPTFADICRDVNADGFPDVLLPVGEFCELWMNPGKAARDLPPGAMPQLTRAARLKVQVRRRVSYWRSRLSDRLESSFVIPRLRTQDVNGDGREDLLVEDGRIRAFHLQREDGAIPDTPDVSLDLAKYRDNTPRGAMRPGRTLAGSDRTSMQSRDLDGDGIPDYVIAHRRKIWVFHGGRDGPQFSKYSQILKSSDDVTTMLLVNLDGDGKPDLVVVKVQVPTIATLILGALGEFDVDVAALGYASVDGRRFEVKPRWRSEITVRLPSIVSIMKDPDAIIRRFEKVGEKFIGAEQADLDGDGRADIIQRDVDKPRLRIWMGSGGTAANDGSGDSLIRQVLFEEEDKVWNIDRMIAWLGKVAESEITRRTGGRPPDSIHPLRDPAGHVLREFRLGDIDGDGRTEIVIAYRENVQGGGTVLDVYRMR